MVCPRYTFGVALEPPCKLLPLEEADFVRFRGNGMTNKATKRFLCELAGRAVLGSPVAELALAGGLL